MENWSFTGRPDVPAWPKDESGRDEKAALLRQTFDSPADADTVTVLWDQESTGHSEYLTNEAGHTLDHVPLKEVVQ